MPNAASSSAGQSHATDRLAGKVAIITGASSGIGEATALQLARAGMKVSLVARRQDRLVALSDAIKKEGLSEPVHFTADVADQKQVNDAVSKTNEKFGRIDLLVNNAGVMYLGPVLGANVEDWKRMFDINVLGLMYCAHAVLPTMKDQKSGHIINISSVSGKVATARSAAYSATKFAVGGFSEGLRQEVAPYGIRVTTIQPGAVATELTNHITDEQTKKTVKDWVAGMTPLASDDIAAAIVYAVSQPQSVNVNELVIRPTDQTL